MQQGAIGAEQDFVRAGAFDSLDQAIPVAYATCVGVDIGETAELINELHVSHPIIGKAPQVRNDEIQVGILGGQHFNCRHSPHDIY